MASHPLTLACLVLAVAVSGCRDAAAPAADAAQTPSAAPAASAPASPAAEQAAAPAPKAGEPTLLQDLETAELLKLNQAWTGDYDEIRSGARRFIRVLVPMNRTLYYVDGPEQRGAAFEALREFEKALAAQAKGKPSPKVAIIPTSRDRLFPALVEGYGDIAIGSLTVTEARAQKVQFSTPTMENVRDVLVTGKSTPPLNSVDDLSGREVHLRRSSSYYDDLTAINERFAKAGKKPAAIVPIDDRLEDEDVLQMVDAGIVPATIAKSIYADFWKQIYDQIQVHDKVAVRENGQLAWAMRQNTPQLTAVVNDFVRTHKVGTLFGNVLVKRYLGDAQRLKNPAAEADLRRFRAAAAYFQKYADQYDFDWLLIAAQAYQESRIDQTVKSSVGAVGVMQIKPETAADVGIKNVDDMEQNIHAGVKYIRFLVDEYYKDEPMERLDKGLFALASYNAGPARVRRLRQKAKLMNLDPNRWFNNVELIAGREIGRETVDYVSNIFKYYTAYTAVAAQRERNNRPGTGTR